MDRTAAVNLKIDELLTIGPQPSEISHRRTSASSPSSTAKWRKCIGANHDAIGKVFKASGIPVTVIGVVGDAKEWDIRHDMVPQAYFPLTAALDSEGFSGRLTVKTSVAPRSVLAAIRADLRVPR